MPEVHRNRAYARLFLGDFERGWPEHEWRLKCRRHLGCRIERPAWRGEHLPDKIIVLHFEQGYGDTLQFIRYAALVKQRVDTVFVLCQPRLLRIVARCAGVDLAFDGSVLHAALRRPRVVDEPSGLDGHDPVDGPGTGAVSAQRSGRPRTLEIGSGRRRSRGEGPRTKCNGRAGKAVPDRCRVAGNPTHIERSLAFLPAAQVAPAGQVARRSADQLAGRPWPGSTARNWTGNSRSSS